jgi:hypothetical protein
MLVKTHFMNKSIICLKISRLPGTYNCVDHSVAIREHHKHAVDIFIQSGKCISIGNVVRCQIVWCEKIFVCVACHTGSVWRMLMSSNSYGAGLLITTGQLILLKTCSLSVCAGVSTADDCLMQMLLSKRQTC